MNKKKLILLALPILCLVLVSAGVMLYYGQITATVKVTQPITVTGDLEYTIEDAMAGETVDAPGYVKISNAAPDERAVMISEYYVPSGIDVIYEHTYSPEDLNARILYHNTNYSVGNSYEDFHNETNSTDKWIGPLPWTDDLETITRVNIIFKLDINENMEPGNYHASFQFRAATENEI